jgi:hypothetical protein
LRGIRSTAYLLLLAPRLLLPLLLHSGKLQKLVKHIRIDAGGARHHLRLASIGAIPITEALCALPAPPLRPGSALLFPSPAAPTTTTITTATAATLASAADDFVQALVQIRHGRSVKHERDTGEAGELRRRDATVDPNK